MKGPSTRAPRFCASPTLLYPSFILHPLFSILHSPARDTTYTAPSHPPSESNHFYPHRLRPRSLSTSVMADKLRAQQQLEALQARYVGTGHADTTKFEWTSNIARDTYASYVGHPPLLQYMSVGMGESREKVRVMMIEVRFRTPILCCWREGRWGWGRTG